MLTETHLLVAATSCLGPADRHEDALVVTDLASGARHAAPIAVEIHATAGIALAVVDAMGGFAWGQPGGELVADALHTALTVPRLQPGDDPRPRLAAAMRAADRAVAAEVARDPRRLGLGASATIAIVSGAWVHLAHLGATRAYRLGEGGLERLTGDHTVGEDPEGGHRPEIPRDIITAALGYAGTVHRVALPPAVELRPGEALLLCTAGLHRHVAEADIATALRAAPHPAAARDALVELAKEAARAGRNRHEEISVVVAWRS